MSGPTYCAAIVLDEWPDGPCDVFVIQEDPVTGMLTDKCAFTGKAEVPAGREHPEDAAEEAAEELLAASGWHVVPPWVPSDNAMYATAWKEGS